MESRKQIDEIEELELQIERLKNSTQENSREELAKAQFNLGVVFDELGEMETAIQAWESIKREDFPDAFAKAQFNLGVTFYKQGKVEKAIQVWESIKREDSREVFAQAQFNLGVTFDDQGKVEKAIQVWASIEREDSPEVFVRAQVNLGATFDERGDVEKAIQFWASIKREDSPEQFAKAQFNLGVTFKQQGETEKAIQVWASIEREDSSEAFAKAQFNLGITFHEQGDVDKAISAFSNAYGVEDYRYYIFKDILDLSDEKFKEPLVSVFTFIDGILESLKVSWKENDLETEIAHYTTPQVGFMMLDNTPSKFRLNTIKGVNDPEEGKVLYRYLEQKIQNDEPLIPFISCFTFNHDSLNQFRLYGKDSGREASGISLVIPKDKFFNQDGDIYSSINSNQSIQKESLGSRVQEETARYIHTLSLYRCIYLDPYQKSDELYLKVSHRDEWTFYRENSDKVPSSRWKEYQEQIGEIENNVRDNLEKIKDILKKIKEMDDEDAINIAEKIILPLRYLIKHAAFREEQECRIIYVSDVCDEKIQVDNKNEQMYIEYGCDLKDVIHKIYLSPGADKYKDHFRRILKDKEGKKVISSTNPFRIK